MLKWCYTDTLPDISIPDTWAAFGCEIELLARLYVMAVKIIAPGLQECVRSRLNELFKAAARMDDVGFLDCVPDFLRAVKISYDNSIQTPDRALRGLFGPFVYAHRSYFKNDKAFKDLMRSGIGNGEFATDMFLAMVEGANVDEEERRSGSEAFMGDD